MNIQLLSNFNKIVSDRIENILLSRLSTSSECKFVSDMKSADIVVIMIDFAGNYIDTIQSVRSGLYDLFHSRLSKRVIVVGFKGGQDISENQMDIENSAEKYGVYTQSEVIIYRMPLIFAPHIDSPVFHSIDNLDEASILTFIYLDDAVTEIIRGIEGYAQKLTNSCYAVVRGKHSISVHEIKKKLEAFRSSLDREEIPRMISDFDRNLFITLMSFGSIRTMNCANNDCSLKSDTAGSFSVKKLESGLDIELSTDFSLKYAYIINGKVLMEHGNTAEVIAGKQKLIIPSCSTVRLKNQTDETVYIMVWNLG